MQTYDDLSGGTYQFMAQVQGSPPGQAAVAQVCLQQSRCVFALTLYCLFNLHNPHHRTAEHGNSAQAPTSWAGRSAQVIAVAEIAHLPTLDLCVGDWGIRVAQGWGP